VKEVSSREREGRKEEGKQKQQNEDLPKQEGAVPDCAGSQWKAPQEVLELSFVSGALSHFIFQIIHLSLLFLD
jgi:hypothetical protein